MEFRKYQHIERYGNSEVEGLEIGNCFVFPKIDGTNSSVWLGDDNIVHGGSHNRELTLDNDNAGFYNAVINDTKIIAYLAKHPTHRLFMEWLVPHSLKIYRDDAWRKYYIFDVCVDSDNEAGLEYLPYNVYQPLLEEFNLEYIAPIRIIKNGSYENFIKCLDENVFLLKDGSGVGEGVVIKNYDFYNKYHKQIWGKIVTSEFKEKHHKAMGAPVTENKMIEESIVEEYLTTAFIEKEYAKIATENNGWNAKMIPQLLGKVFYELVNEEMWNIVKKFKTPTVNFKTLNALTINRIKTIKPEIFG